MKFSKTFLKLLKTLILEGILILSNYNYLIYLNLPQVKIRSEEAKKCEVTKNIKTIKRWRLRRETA